MSLPKKRTSKSKRNMRRSHQRQKDAPASLAKCNRCGEPKLPHRVCTQCGYYANREVIQMDQI